MKQELNMQAVHPVRGEPQDTPAAQFRVPMMVTERMVFPTTSCYVCPRCNITMEREFMRFCDRCGQRLDWRDYRKARIVYPGPYGGVSDGWA